MYNGVGVQTARGTGTSGHVRKNLGSLRPLRHDVRRLKELRDKQPILREADPGIVHHNELRKIEVQLLKMRELWENEGVSEEEIESRISRHREELRQNLTKSSAALVHSATETHAQALEREARNTRVASALGIRQESPANDRFQVEPEVKSDDEQGECRSRRESRSSSDELYRRRDRRRRVSRSRSLSCRSRSRSRDTRRRR